MQKVKLISFDCDPAHRLRIQELGLRPGQILVVTNRGPFGGRVVNIGGSRIAVDAHSAKHIVVEPVI